MDKEYLGDAVYVEHDEYGLILTTEDGISVSNTIYLEPEVCAALAKYMRRMHLDATGRKLFGKTEAKP